MGQDNTDTVPAMRRKAASPYTKNLRRYLHGPDSHQLNEVERIVAVKEVAREQMIESGGVLRLSEVERRLREKVFQRMGNTHNAAIGQFGLRRAFLMFDPANVGVVTPANFIKILSNFGFAKNDAALLFRKYDPTGSGSIALADLQSQLMAPPANKGNSSIINTIIEAKAQRDAAEQQNGTSTADVAAPRVPLSEVERRLRDKLHHRVGNLYNRSMGQLGEERAFSLFQPVDGCISRDNFVEVLKSFSFSQEDAIALFRKLDMDQNNALDLREFKQFFFGRSGVTQERQQRRPTSCHSAFSSHRQGSPSIIGHTRSITPTLRPKTRSARSHLRDVSTRPASVKAERGEHTQKAWEVSDFRGTASRNLILRAQSAKPATKPASSHAPTAGQMCDLRALQSGGIIELNS